MKMAQRSIRRREAHIGVSALRKKAGRHSVRGNYGAAAACLRRALRGGASPGPDRLMLWNERGMVCKYGGEFDMAERYYRLALRHARRCFTGKARDFFLANVRHNLGGLEHSRGRFSRAEKYARKSVELRLKAGAPDSLAVASDRAALAAILDGLHKFTESEKHYLLALRVY